MAYWEKFLFCLCFAPRQEDSGDDTDIEKMDSEDVHVCYEFCARP